MRVFPLFQTVRMRLTVVNVLVLALVLLALGVVLRISVDHNLMASVDNDLAGRSRGHKAFWANLSASTLASWQPPPSPDRSEKNTQDRQKRAPAITSTAESDSRWKAPVIERVFGLDGKQTFPPFEKNVPWDRSAFARALIGQETYSMLRDGQEQVRLLTVPLRLKEGQIGGIVQMGYSLSEVERTLGNLDRTLMTLIPFALLVAGFGGLFLTGRMLRPVRDITRTAAQIGAESLAQRLCASGQDEFSELARTFNAMLARLEQSFEQQRRFTADASHELRTPLTVIKANTSLLLSQDGLPAPKRKMLESVDTAATLMSRVVQDLLLLAHSDAGQLHIPLRPTPLAEVLEVALACLPPESEERIRFQPPHRDLAVQGDASHLTRLFVNLLDNAIRHTQTDGCITLAVRPSENAVVVTVADTGVGIAPEHLPHVCERFYRVDDARSRSQGGAGLGLAICQCIALAHGSSLHIESQPGNGTSVQVTLCAAKPSPG